MLKLVHKQTEHEYVCVERDKEGLKSYKVSCSVELNVLFCQILEGSEPFNELLKRDLQWKMVSNKHVHP